MTTAAMVFSALVITSLVIWLRVTWNDCAWWHSECKRLQSARGELNRHWAAEVDQLDSAWTDRYRSLAGQFMDADETDAAVDAAVKRIHSLEQEHNHG